MFQYPGPQGARPSELAARLGITKQALDYLLGELERLDYLERQPDPDGLRSKRVVLTRRGASAIRIIREAVAEIRRPGHSSSARSASPSSAPSSSSSTS